MEVKLNKNGWHRKLQLWVFDNPPMYQNFCPYFWLTNFCIFVTFIFPVVPLVRLLFWFFKGAAHYFNELMDAFEEHVCKPAFARAAKSMNDDAVVRAWCIHQFDGGSWNWKDEDWADYDFWCKNYFNKNPMTAGYKKREEMQKKFEVWKSKTPNWEEKLQAIKEKRRQDFLKHQEERKKREEKALEELQKNAEKIERSRIRKQKIFTNIVKYTKWLAILIGVACLLAAGYGAYLGIKYCWDHFYWDKFVIVMKYIGMIVALAVTLILIVMGIVKLVTSTACRSIGLCRLFETKAMKWVGNKLSLFFIWLGQKVIVPAAKKFCDLCEFFWMYIMAIKKDYCPGIVWEEEKKA